MRKFLSLLVLICLFCIFCLPIVMEYVWNMPVADLGFGPGAIDISPLFRPRSFNATYETLMIPFEKFQEMLTDVENVIAAVSSFWDEFVEKMIGIFT